MAPAAQSWNNDQIPAPLRKPIGDAAQGHPGSMAQLWKFMKHEGFAEQARLARDSQRAGIVSRAAAKCFNAPSKSMRAQESARGANSSLKGKGKGKGKEASTKGKGKGKDKGKGSKLTGHEFTNATILNENMLQFEDEVPAHRITPTEELGREPGFLLGTLELMYTTLEGSRDEDPDDIVDTALIVAKELKDITSDDIHGIIIPRFEPVEVTLYLQRDDHSRPMAQKCTIFKIGGRQLHYCDYLIPKIDVPLSVEIKMNYAIHRREVSETVWKAITDSKSGEKSIDTLVTRIIGKANIPTDGQIEFWAPPKEDTKDKWGESRKGSIKVLRTVLQEVQQRSCKEGVVLRPAIIDGSTEIYPFPRKTKREDALDQSELLAAISYGVVPFNEGFAVRFEKGKKQQVKTILESEMTKVIGVDLMLAEKSEGKDYIIRNVCKEVRPAQMAHHMKHALKWLVRVDRVDSKANFSNTFHVFAKEPPRLWGPLMMDHLTGTYQPVTISEVTFKGSQKGLRCFKPRESESTKDDEGWHHQRAEGLWADYGNEEEDEFYDKNGEHMEDDAEEESDDPKELERLSYIARKEKDQDQQRQARLKLRKEEVLNAMEKNDNASNKNGYRAQCCETTLEAAR